MSDDVACSVIYHSLLWTPYQRHMIVPYSQNLAGGRGETRCQSHVSFQNSGLLSSSLLCHVFNKFGEESSQPIRLSGSKSGVDRHLWAGERTGISTNMRLSALSKYFDSPFSQNAPVDCTWWTNMYRCSNSYYQVLRHCIVRHSYINF